eukprot:696012-Hanusia_phi.AAC.1
MMQQYWRIDYKLLIDAIKLRIHKMKKALHVMPVEAITRYVCNNCVDDDGNHPCWDEHDVQQLQWGIDNFEVTLLSPPHIAHAGNVPVMLMFLSAATLTT